MTYITDAVSFVWDSIRTMRVSDILDIAVVAFLVYKLFAHFSRTGSGRLLRGIVLALLVMWITSMLTMPVINFFIGQTFQLGFLALIILFQPELRHLLERFGSGGLSKIVGPGTRYGDNRVVEDAILQVAAACSDMAATKTGALIIFERNIRLADVAKTGTAMNAIIRVETLKNIFYPKTPLHDGAVIIRDGLILSAACVLPLSANPTLDRNLGTRHRAALGMSEHSDCISVVVSEETGQISCAVGGMLKRRLNAEALAKLLRTEMGANGETSVSMTEKLYRKFTGQ
ncbi:MAG: diadenylate cyclase CdaA [Oscillospiraceae bacterium]|jgi:diadenylate cyclase|nr:diadenylate cyclase CdaA [Oscillospiraceae bacterium]